jgi:S-layer protein (TIGR01567 family)
MNRMVGRKIGTSLITLVSILLLACAGQAAVPVSPSESRFVWEPGENLSFTWTPENFDGFFYDPENRAGSEKITIKLDDIADRIIPEKGMEYSTAITIADARYRPFGKYAVIGFMGEKYLAGYPAGRSNISYTDEINLNSLHKILMDEGAIYTLADRNKLNLGDAYSLMITDVNVPDASVTLSLLKDGYLIDTKVVKAGRNYYYMRLGRQIITVHVDHVIGGNGTGSIMINGIFQVSEYSTPVNEGDIHGLMKITNVSESSITMRNTDVPVPLYRGSHHEILEGILLNVADSNDLRIQLASDRYLDKIERRGAAGSDHLTVWDGLNYAGFWYDIDSGNYSESLEITNMDGRTIPEEGIKYTSYRIQVPYAVTRVKGKIPPGTDGTYPMHGLGGYRYAVRNKGLARILVEQGENFHEKKTFSEMETWELGEGYALSAPFINTFSPQWDAQIILKKNGTELQNMRLMNGNIYAYAEGTDEPILITYLESIFSGTTFNLIQLKYTWLVSGNAIEIKEGERFGVFSVTKVSPEMIVMKNRVPVELKPGSSINLMGNLSLYVENSDELKFYPISTGGAQVMPEGVSENEIVDNPGVTPPAIVTPSITAQVAGKTERAAGFEVFISISMILAAYKARRR